MPTLMLNVPEKQYDTFCGRDGALELLSQALPDTSLMWLHGITGLGKSSLALEYVNRYKNRYEAIYWVDAGDTGKVQQAFSRLSALRDLLPDATDNNDRPCLHSGPKWPSTPWPQDSFEKRSVKWLIVLDGVDDFDWDTIDRFRPPRSDASVLVTSRKCNRMRRTVRAKAEPPSAGAMTVELLPFTEVEASTALKRMAGIPSDNEDKMVSRLTALLGYLPLAISIAATLIRVQCMTLADLLASYDYDYINARFSVIVTQQNLLRRKLVAKNNRRLVNHHQRSDGVDRDCQGLAITWNQPKWSDQRVASLQRFRKRIGFHVG
ncbi:uncharacterized protein CLAFUR5_20232 [Fulvia fulva]|uniref:uncharacterized protein n=1 Tax=Passalora fulva TaxID=5499 RepID=UPI002852BF49|nr:uncharacterized protein CLAFUR5_20232 [Fulvia fulva]WMI38935.1 hypothetical protein CLAFUR5_20232 [Fulvia fulva]WPV31442.1 hypothetical protein CLAFUW7_07095 [Fulvia fulva]